MGAILKTVTLVPFDSPKHPGLGVQVQVTRKGFELGFAFTWSGEPKLPAPKVSPERLDGLWNHTCFEVFLTWGVHPYYWEINFSPSGDWNLYRFDSYREGAKTEAHTQVISTDLITKNSRAFRLNLKAILPNESESLALGITSVLELPDSSKSYWALTHAGPKPDFHIRESFILEV